MKNFKSLLSNSQYAELKATFFGMFRVKAGRGLVNWLNRLVFVIVKKRKASLTRCTVVFLRSCYCLYKVNGIKYVVLYLKTCHVHLMQSVGGHVVKDSALISKVRVSKTSSGLPRIIPRVHREAIRSGDRIILRIYLTLFSIYRVFSYPSVTSLVTIIEPGKSLSEKLLVEWNQVILFTFSSLSVTPEKFRKTLSTPVPFMISKSSPVLRLNPWTWKYDPKAVSGKTGQVGMDVKVSLENLSTSYHAIMRSAWVLSKNIILWPIFVRFCEQVYPGCKFPEWMKEISQKAHLLPVRSGENSPLSPDAPIGALGFKDEAAGKVRVFAMVDCWTQWLLKPLHSSLFQVLDKFPTDGTHDQLKPIRRLIEQGHTKFWCYDLSSATDRLPVSLQANVLDFLLGGDLGQDWMRLLVHRKYHLPKPSSENPRVFDQKYGTSVLYAVGQPMGALSSWAMLALTHHLMVALAAKRAGYAIGSFHDYAVLGDDIVIANGKVAREYLLICSEIGVKVGIHKSLISRKGVLEFAKKYYVKGIDCSPVPLMELGAATSSITAVLELARKYKLSLPALATVLGAGYKTLGSLTKWIADITPRYRHLGILYFSPWGISPLKPFIWLNMRYLFTKIHDDTQPEGFKTLMEQRFEKLRLRLEVLEKTLRGWRGSYLQVPCVKVYNQICSQSKAVGIPDISPIFGVIYKPIIQIYSEMVRAFRADCSKFSEQVSGAIYGFGMKEDHVLLWDAIRHSLALVRRFPDINKKSSARLVSAAHVWDLWKTFPKKARPKTVRKVIIKQEPVIYVDQSGVARIG